MTTIISIPFQEKVSTRRSGNTEGLAEFRVHPFLAGPENYIICSAVYDVIQNHPSPFALLFQAPEGYGKSHLVEGLLLTWLTRNPDGPGKMVSALDFSREWNQAQRTREAQNFFESYHALDFFVLEELQEIAAHPAAQEQLVQTLDLLLKRGARVILTMNQPLSSVTLIPKLASRLNQGVSIEIHLPELETRKEILRLPEYSQNIPIQEEILNEFAELADQEKLPIGEMLQRFQKLEWLRKSSRETEIHSGIIHKVFPEPETEKSQSVSIVQIAKLTAKFYKIKVSDLRGKSRKTTFVTARDLVYYMARHLTGATLDEIGTYFGGRDHSTILHGCEQAEALIQSNEEVKRCFDFLNAELKGKHI